MDQSELPQEEKRFKRKKKKNLWNTAQKEKAWELFSNNTIDPRNLPPKREILDIIDDISVFREFKGSRYPQLREHLRKLSSKFILREELKDKRREEGKCFV